MDVEYNESMDGDFDSAMASAGMETLGQSEIKQDRFDVLNVDPVGAVFQIVTHVNLTQSCGAIAMASAGMRTDKDYGSYGEPEF
jgi:hypothetical protein